EFLTLSSIEQAMQTLKRQRNDIDLFEIVDLTHRGTCVSVPFFSLSLRGRIHSQGGKLPSAASAVIRHVSSCMNWALSPFQVSGSPTNTSQKRGTSRASPRGNALPSPCRNTG